MLNEIQSIKVVIDAVRDSIQHWKALYEHEKAKTAELENIINNYLADHSPEHLGIRKLGFGGDQ